jgi:hypothetical protein
MFQNYHYSTNKGHKVSADSPVDETMIKVPIQKITRGLNPGSLMNKFIVENLFTSLSSVFFPL